MTFPLSSPATLSRIRIILSTAKGERVMRPDFGCDIHGFAFATLNTTNLMMMRSAVREALTRWEPRIEVQDVVLESPTGADLDRGLLTIDVRYCVRGTNFATNLVYPFYLNAGG